jgi:lipopolysaccharide export system protein LptA
MRTSEAARYARWAAGVAILLMVIVAGVYFQRRWEESRARREAPPPVPSSVQQQSAEFSFSKVEKDHTLFTVRASRATEFKGQSKSLLEDVWITVYGRDGKRFDNLHTRECSYEPGSGRITCQGDVEMDLESAQEAKQEPGARVIHVATKNVSFDRESGIATTGAPVEFRFPYGEGHGRGVTYDSRAAKIRLEHDVELNLRQASPSAVPVIFSGGSLEYRRNEHILRLSAPARVRQGDQELTADSLALILDADLHARRAVASGNPRVRGKEARAQFRVSAAQFEAVFHPAGWVEQVLASGGVHGWRSNKGERDEFQAHAVTIEMEQKSNLPKQFLASGDVRINSQGQGESRRVETAQLQVQFGTGTKPRERQVQSAESPGPAFIETKAGDDDTQIRAARLDAQFTPQGRLGKVQGHSGTEIHRQLGKGAPQVTTARELAMTFGRGGEWETVEESGDVRYRQGERTAHADRARFVNATDAITLEGAPSISDGVSNTTAGTMEINQRTGDLHATGGVRTSYDLGENSGPTFGSGPAHISASSLSGNTAKGHLIYSGGARLWQGESVLEAETIELWRSEQRLEARDHVIALIPEVQKPGKSAPGAVLWHVRAPKMGYWSGEGRARLEGGVSAESEQGSLYSRSLELFLAPVETGAAQGADGQRRLARAVALGNVEVRQSTRRAAAERAEYFAADGKFVLSGGRPTLTDAAQDTTTGVQLTFYTANDTILVDSQAGSRTLTRHRVEK